LSKRTWILLGTAIPVLGLLVLLGWASFGWSGGQGGFGVNQEFGQIEVTARPAAQFTLESMDGEQVDLSELRGKVVLVDFWASWCAPCRQEAATLKQVYQEYAGQPVEFIGVNIWDRQKDAIQYVSDFGIPYPNGVDESGTIAIDYGVRGIPEKFFIDSNGMVQHKFVGPMHPEALRSTLDKLLASRASGKLSSTGNAD
jgi:cytochrome c biogenesis protein CcmG/thiol:disulfide interchange protein DsbE